MDLVTPWHTHELHQLLYAFEGVAEVETEDARHLLPPQQAAWIPAGLPHQTTLRNVRSVAVFFEPAMVAEHGDRVRVLSTAAPVREMIVYAMRWPIHRPASDPTADAFFAALALLATEWLDAEAPPLRLPDQPGTHRPRGDGVHAGPPRRRHRERGERGRRAVRTLVAPPVPGRHRDELAAVPDDQPRPPGDDHPGRG
jgi:hypothetical protein